MLPLNSAKEYKYLLFFSYTPKLLYVCCRNRRDWRAAENEACAVARHTSLARPAHNPTTCPVPVFIIVSIRSIIFEWISEGSGVLGYQLEFSFDNVLLTQTRLELSKLVPLVDAASQVCLSN